MISTTKPKSFSKDSAISHWLPFAAALIAAPKPEVFGVIQVPKMEVRKPMQNLCKRPGYKGIPTPFKKTALSGRYSSTSKISYLYIFWW